MASSTFWVDNRVRTLRYPWSSWDRDIDITGLVLHRNVEIIRHCVVIGLGDCGCGALGLFVVMLLWNYSVYNISNSFRGIMEDLDLTRRLDDCLSYTLCLCPCPFFQRCKEWFEFCHGYGEY